MLLRLKNSERLDGKFASITCCDRPASLLRSADPGYCDHWVDAPPPSRMQTERPEPLLTPSRKWRACRRIDGVPLGHIKPLPRDKRATQGAASRPTPKQTRQNASEAALREQPPASPKSTRVTASRPRASTNAPTGSDFSRAIAKRPHVRWVLDGEELTELDPPELLDSFRLDFDETRRLSFDDLPYAFMTENSQRGSHPPRRCHRRPLRGFADQPRRKDCHDLLLHKSQLSETGRSL